MNAPQDPDPLPLRADEKERRDALLTAHALGQLDDSERADVERRLADPEATTARADVADMRRLATAIRSGRADDQPPRSSALRRAVVAAAAARRESDGDVRPAAQQTRGHFTRWLLWGGGIAAAVAVVASIGPFRREAMWEREVAIRTDGGPRPGGLEDERGVTAATATPAEQPDAKPGLRKAQVEEAKGRFSGLADAPGQPVAAATAPVDTAASGNGMSAGGERSFFGGPPTAKKAAVDGLARGPSRRDEGSRLEVEQAADQQRASVQPAPMPSAPVASAPVASAPVASAPVASGAAPEPQRRVAATLDGKVASRELAEMDRTTSARVRQDAAGTAELGAADKQSDRLSELARGDRPRQELSRERYEAPPENRFQASREQPLSTLSIDVDTASYANVRRFLSEGRLPPPEAVRLEEMINYFPYAYPQPAGDAPFSVTVEGAACPWRSGHRIIRIGLQGREIDRRERPAGNIVFLVDVSGSMADADKLPLVKQSLSMLVEELTEDDRVAIVTYAGEAGLRLPSTSGDQKPRIRAAIEGLSAGGSTHGSAGIVMAYEQAAAHFVRGGVNRVILATDGDLNVGVTSDEALVDLITEKAKGGTFLTVLGFGTGNLQDAKMEKIADHGNGIYAYIDGLREARKVLVEQLTGSTITIAKDVKIQVEFNPAQVVSYRLLGYENRILAAQDFRDDRKDAGEIGAGHRVTALYEVALVGEDGGGPAGAEPLKYQPRSEPAAPVDAAISRELLTVKLRWKRPDADASVLQEVPCVDRGGAFEAASDDLRFAAAVAGFGMILRGSAQKGAATLPLVAGMAAGAMGRDPGGYRAEFLDLVRKAESLGAGASGPR